jgi:hypothetical protein
MVAHICNPRFMRPKKEDLELQDRWVYRENAYLKK